MQSQIIAVLLCVFAATAGAHSVSDAQTPQAQTVAQALQTQTHAQRAQAAGNPTARTDSVATRPLAASNARPGIITAAGATTPDGPVRVRDNASVTRATMGAPAQDQPAEGHGSVAMVLAALALMSGIALRRSGTIGR